MCTNVVKYTILKLEKKIFFLVVWKHAKMHQNPFLTLLKTLKNIFFKAMFLVVWKHAQMHQNTFSTTPEVKKYFFFPGGLEPCENELKHGLKHSRRKIFFFSGGLEACANASKRVFNHSRRRKISFLRPCFGWSGSMRICIKTCF